jgi:hypothetical protein
MAQTTEKYIYSRILDKASLMNIIPNKSREAREWFRKKAQTYRGGSYARINREKLLDFGPKTAAIVPGKMYMYSYDAKTKDKLPYWDAFPVIFPVSLHPNGFDGLNLHYLPPALRARLMDALYENLTNQRFDDTTKIRMSYQILKSAASLSLFKPCYKRYLYSHVRSDFIYVEPKEWDIAMFLPLARWQKASARQVYNDSAKKART